ncbi:MAG: type II toxin-antitoxin system death-on-curing family toxin [Microbacteriaceae bacterium]|nr:type II toxin-antitoxin system death-on-curing family toxin [Microbacteriaceae bacterium]
MTVFLDLEIALELILRQDVGPIRDAGLLDAALQRPASTLFGADAYPDLAAKAAAMLESIVRNHSLVDGNERFGWFATMVFLDLNGADLDIPADEACDFVIDVAAGRLDLDAITGRFAAWIGATRR